MLVAVGEGGCEDLDGEAYDYGAEDDYGCQEDQRGNGCLHWWLSPSRCSPVSVLYAFAKYDFDMEKPPTTRAVGIEVYITETKTGRRGAGKEPAKANLAVHTHNTATTTTAAYHPPKAADKEKLRMLRCRRRSAAGAWGLSHVAVEEVVGLV